MGSRGKLPVGNLPGGVWCWKTGLKLFFFWMLMDRAGTGTRAEGRENKRRKLTYLPVLEKLTRTTSWLCLFVLGCSREDEEGCGG